MSLIIRTKYRTHPGSNVGAIRATGAGRQATVRYPQELSGADAHRVAAQTLASRLGVVLSTEETATDSGYDFVTLDAWAPDEARRLAATARRMFRDHGHGSAMDRLTRENCGACVLGGYGALDESSEGGSPLAPNHAAWARTYIQANRPIPQEWRAAFVHELNGSPYRNGPRNLRYADALRRDILTFGGWDL